MSKKCKNPKIFVCKFCGENFEDFPSSKKKFCNLSCSNTFTKIGHKCSEETKKIMSLKKKGLPSNHKGYKMSKEAKLKLSNRIVSKETRLKRSKAMMGKKSWRKGCKHSEETKHKIRIKKVERLRKQENFYPSYNSKACEFFKSYDGKNNTKGKYALNGGEYCVEELGYWLDYINFEKKLIMEYDEKHHFYADGSLKEKDLQRQKEIQDFYPDFEFVRIKEDGK